MIKVYGKFCDYLTKVYATIGLVMLIVIAIAGVVQVVTRYILGQAVVGSEELSRYCFIWLGFTGSVVCVHNWSNAQVSILNDALPGKAKSIHSILLNILVFVCAAVLFWQGIKCVRITGKQTSSLLKISLSYVYLAIPVGAFGMMAVSLQRLLYLISGRTLPEAEVKES